MIPANRLSPVALNILAKVPQPNIPGAGFGQVNYELPSSEREKTTNAFNVKLNYNPGVNDQMSLRFSYQRPEIFVPGTFGELGGAGADFAGTGYQNTYSTALTWTRTLSSSLIMEWRAGYSKYHNEALSTGQGLETSTEVGIPGANYDEFSSGISRIQINQGFTVPMVGFSPSLPWDRGEETVSVVGTLTKVTGNHTLKVGTEVRHNEDFLLQIQDAGGVRGQFNFTGAQTSIPSNTAATAGLANAFASFLLDVPGQIQRDVKVIDRPGTKHWAVFAFVQDKWQVTPKLTIDLGLRWEYYTPLVGIEDQGGLSNYDITNNTVQIAGYGSVPQNIGVREHLDELRPAAGSGLPLQREDGAAGRLRHHDRAVPRQPLRLQLPGQADEPVQRSQRLRTPQAAWPPASARRTSSTSPRAGSWTRASRSFATSQLFYVQPDLKEAKLHGWNVALQRSCPGTWWARSPTSATWGAASCCPTTTSTPDMTLGADNAGRPYNQLYGRTANVLSWLPTDTSYNALQAKLDRRFRNGFLVTTSYTLARAQNYQEETAGTFTPADIERMNGRASFDRTHAFAASFIWELPFFKQDKSALGWILGGWQLGGDRDRVLGHARRLHRETPRRYALRATCSAPT